MSKQVCSVDSVRVSSAHTGLNDSRIISPFRMHRHTLTWFTESCQIIAACEERAFPNLRPAGLDDGGRGRSEEDRQAVSKIAPLSYMRDCFSDSKQACPARSCLHERHAAQSRVGGASERATEAPGRGASCWMAVRDRSRCASEMGKGRGSSEGLHQRAPPIICSLGIACRKALPCPRQRDLGLRRHGRARSTPRAVQTPSLPQPALRWSISRSRPAKETEQATMCGGASQQMSLRIPARRAFLGPCRRPSIWLTGHAGSQPTYDDEFPSDLRHGRDGVGKREKKE